jgi:spermidine/putrescine transport system permease protein
VSAVTSQGRVLVRRTTIVLTLGLLFLPLAVIVLLSFNASRYGTLPFEFTLRWYTELFGRGDLFVATRRSILLSTGTALASALIGTSVSVWLVRHRPRALPVVSAGLLSAVTIPWLILGIGMLTVFQTLGIGRSTSAVFLGSLVTSLPYQVFIVLARLRALDPSLEEAARSLGASALRAQARVVVPLISSAVLGGALMAFTITFNNFVIQYFLMPFGVRTLPLEIYTLVRTGYKPDINALSTLVLLATVVLIVALQRLVGGVQRTVRPVAGPRPDRGRD